MDKKSKIIRNSVFLTLVCCAVALAVFAAMTFQNGSILVEKPEIEETHVRSWHRIPLVLGDAPLAHNETGVSYEMSYPHQAVPATAYASNLSNATAYEFYDGLDNEMTGDTPYDTTFDLVVKVQVNATLAYNTTGSTWELDWIYANMTCADLSVGASTECVETEIGNNATYIWVHYYLQDADGGAGSGFTLTHGESFNVTEFEFWAYY